MAAFDYSDDALNVKAAFYGAQKMVYVEGEDDVIFWESVFRVFDKDGLKVESLGGLQELNKMINKITNSEVDAIAARDSDFTELDASYTPDDKIIRTYGHSIENTLVVPESLHMLTTVYGRVSEGTIPAQDLSDWMDDIERFFADLILHDAANDISQLGLSVLGNNCTRFMTGKDSCTPSIQKINDHLTGVKSNKSITASVKMVTHELHKLGKKVLDFMRGHFIASAAMKKVNKLIQESGGNKVVTNDSFSSSLFMAFDSFFNARHPHFEHYRQQVSLV